MNQFLSVVQQIQQDLLIHKWKAGELKSESKKGGRGDGGATCCTIGGSSRRRRPGRRWTRVLPEEPDSSRPQGECEDLCGFGSPASSPAWFDLAEDASCRSRTITITKKNHRWCYQIDTDILDRSKPRRERTRPNRSVGIGISESRNAIRRRMGGIVSGG